MNKRGARSESDLPRLRRSSRPTKGIPPDRYQFNTETLDLKYARNGYAAQLTAILNTARSNIEDERSRLTLSVTCSKIEAAVKSLHDAHMKYTAVLQTKTECQQAMDWFNERQDIANKILEEIGAILVSKSVKSVSVISSLDDNATIHSGSNNYGQGEISRANMVHKAEQSKLKAFFADEAAKLAEKMTELHLNQSKQIAEMQTTQVKQEARHRKDMADLEVKLYHDMLEISSNGTDRKVNLQECGKHDFIQEWLEASDGAAVKCDSVNQQNLKSDRLTPQVQETHRPQPTPFNIHAPSFMPSQPQVTVQNYRPSEHDEPIDAWIDRLIPGQETILEVHSSDRDHLTHALIKLESERDLPKVDLPKFSGKAIEWPRFVDQFHAQVHTRPGINDVRRMDLLQSHLEGDAKHLVLGLGYSGRNYALALQELKNAFGHRIKVARAFLDRVTSGPMIVSHDPSSLRRLYVALRDCITTLEQFQYFSDLHSPDIVLKVAKRLPSDKITKWNEFVRHITRTREPNLYDLNGWLRDRVDADFNPYAITLGAHASTPRKPSKADKPSFQSYKGIERQSTVYATTVAAQDKQGSKAPPPQKGSDKQFDNRSKLPCPMCKQPHYLYHCPLFSNKSVPERNSVVTENKLCFNCLKPSHTAERCFSFMTCREPGCGKKHHTLLHRTNSVPAEAVNKKMQSPGNTVFFQIVPIFAYGQSGRVLKTFALLDSASNVTLIHDEFVQELGLKGQQQMLKVTTCNCTTTEPSSKVSLNIKSADVLDAPYIHVKEAWTVKSNAFDCRPQHVNPEWEHIKHLDMPSVEPAQIQMLIGLNVPEAHLQVEAIEGQKTEPIAVRTALGWSLMGVANCDSSANQEVQVRVNLTIAKDLEIHQSIERFWKTESFGAAHDKKQPSSIEDRKAEHALEGTTCVVDGHYQVGMLWKRADCTLPNNYTAAERRFKVLAKRLVNDKDFEIMYNNTMNGYIAKGQAQKLTQEQITSVSPRTWYIPHHGVTNPNKPGKVRVVFDAAASYAGTSLNDSLLSGPDLVNNLFGVIQRFRLYSVALMADVEGMFHQVRVPEHDSDSLRFLWKADSQQPGSPDLYKMVVHIFGAADSCSCACYALRRTAQDNADDFHPSIIEAVLRDFYVDDLVKSVETIAEAIQMTQDLSSLMKRGGFHLHKWVSNSDQVLDAIPESEKAIQCKDFDLDEQPVQRALGLRWNVKQDCFTFNPKHKEVTNTKRAVVSAVCSIFDPCGYLAPFTIRAKFLIQEMWRRGLSWDDHLPTDIHAKWEGWHSELKQLNEFSLPRHHPQFSSESAHIEVHVFADSSEKGFGAVAYLRYILNSVTITCSFLASKTHVAPLTPQLTIPRLELQGGVLAIRLWVVLNKELNLKIGRVVFWTDSNTVLQYLNNEKKRFKPFVANRVAEILDSSDSRQWRHVASADNPADYSTRGLPACSLQQSHPWFRGPDFLWKTEDYWPSHEIPGQTLDDDPEIKGKCVMKNLITQSQSLPDLQGLKLSGILDPTDFSSWQRLVGVSAWILRAVRNFLSTLKHKNLKSTRNKTMTARERSEAEHHWIEETQREAFPKEVDNLEAGQWLSAKSNLIPLSPTFDGRFIRVGGRLRKAHIPTEAKYQIIMPCNHPVTHLIMEDMHVKSAHCGQEHLIALVRQQYWPINARKLAKHVLRNCCDCHRRRAKPYTVKMADLPICRMSAFEGVFAHTGVDYFGPMMVKERRSTVKRWGCLFTCLSTRAVHIELADSLETDDFLLVLRSFIGRRGHPGHLYSDNGTNFRGADNELYQCLQNLKQTKIADYITPMKIEWHFNPPLSPHFGGAWERLVRSVKTALKAVLKNLCVRETVLRVALIEVEAVLNSRPLTYNSTSPSDFTALTPNHFILGRAQVCTLPDVFHDNEIESRRRWRQAQVIADHVFNRWQREYLPELTVRKCWRSESQNISAGDLVLVVDEAKPRGHWDLARIVEVYVGDDGRVRTLKIQTKTGQYIRPAAKVCVLEESVCNDS